MYSDWTCGDAFDSASMKPVTSSSSPVGSSMTRISNTLTQPAITEAVVVGLRVMPRERLLLKVNLKTGVCAGITGMTVMPRRVADYFVEHLAGVSSMECATEDISGMRLTATVSESQDGSGLLELRNLDATARQKKLNRELERSRDERKGCSSQAPCNQCSRTVDQCPLAVFLPEPGGVK